MTNQFLFLFLVCFCLFRAAPAAYGSSQARGRIGAYTTATAMAVWHPSSSCDIHCRLQQRQILNPLNRARNQMQVLWVLVGFVTAEPQKKLPANSFLCPLLLPPELPTPHLIDVYFLNFTEQIFLQDRTSGGGSIGSKV